MCVDLKTVIKQERWRRESRGVADSLTVSPCIGNERECGGRQLQAVTSRTLLHSAVMRGLKNAYTAFWGR